MKTFLYNLLQILILLGVFNTSHAKNSYPRFLFNDSDIEVFINMVNDVRAQHGLLPFSYNKDTERFCRIRNISIYNRILNKSYREIRDSAQEWLHYGFAYDALSFNVELDFEKKLYSLINPSEICAGFLNIRADLGRDSLFKVLLTGWMNSPSHRVKLLSEDDDTFAISFANYGDKQGVFATMVIYTKFSMKKNRHKKRRG